MLPRVNGGPADGAARQLTKSEEERRGNGGQHARTHVRTRTRTDYCVAQHQTTIDRNYAGQSCAATCVAI